MPYPPLRVKRLGRFVQREGLDQVEPALGVLGCPLVGRAYQLGCTAAGTTAQGRLGCEQGEDEQGD